MTSHPGGVTAEALEVGLQMAVDNALTALAGKAKHWSHESQRSLRSPLGANRSRNSFGLGSTGGGPVLQGMRSAVHWQPGPDGRSGARR